MADEYDDTCSTVFPLLQTILSSVSVRKILFPSDSRPISEHLQYKRSRKMSTEPIDASKRSFLASLLEVILEKLKWDPETDPDELDDDDKVAFEGLRKVYTLFFKLCCYI